MSSNHKETPIELDVCPECFDKYCIGAIVDGGWCSKCGERLYKPRDYVSEFLATLNVSPGTKASYRSLLASGEERITKRLEEWQSKNE